MRALGEDFSSGVLRAGVRGTEEDLELFRCTEVTAVLPDPVGVTTPNNVPLDGIIQAFVL